MSRPRSPWTQNGQRPQWTGQKFIRELYHRNRILFVVALANLTLAILFTALMHVDGRMLLGRNVWTKPWKFATSIAIFTATIAWLLPSLSLTERIEQLTTYTIGAAMTIEIILISTQAARGVRSHFNESTTLDTAIFAVMGLTITLSTVAVAYVLWRVVRNPPDLAPAYLWGIRLGMLVFVVASFEGFLMIAQSSHSIGAPSDGPGLPLLNWSVTGGDLRIAHFIGLHALQILPLTGYVAARWERLSTHGSLLAVGIVGSLYATLTGATFVLAMQGQPLVSSLPELSMATLFSASFLLVAPFWACMILAPGWNVTERLVSSPLIILPAATLYLLLLLPQLTFVASGVISPSLSKMTTLFAQETGTTLVWVHFLAFDLFVGRWIYLDAKPRSIPRPVLSLALLATLLFGPVGFLGYHVIRPISAASRKPSIPSTLR